MNYKRKIVAILFLNNVQYACSQPSDALVWDRLEQLRLVGEETVCSRGCNYVCNSKSDQETSSSSREESRTKERIKKKKKGNWHEFHTTIYLWFSAVWRNEVRLCRENAILPSCSSRTEWPQNTETKKTTKRHKREIKKKLACRSNVKHDFVCDTFSYVWNTLQCSVSFSETRLVEVLFN